MSIQQTSTGDKVVDKDHGSPQAMSLQEQEEIEGQLNEVDPIAEAKLVRKLDLYIIPVVMLLYLLSFLDR